MTTTEVTEHASRSRDVIEREPSEIYDGVFDPAEIDRIYKAQFAAAAEEAGDMFAIHPDVAQRLAEDYRLAHVRILRRRGKSASGSTRGPAIQTARAVRNDDGETITCSCGCGVAMPAKKFPTMKIGGRGSVSRECEKRIRAERKASK